MNPPDGIKPMLTTGEAARVLRVSESRVSSWLKGGRLAYCQAGPSAWRMIAAAELARFSERHGWPLAWEHAL